MAALGNLFLILATLAFLVLQSPSYRKPMPGGDAGVGYAWGIIIFNLAFFICMGIVAIIIGAKGGFEWVSPKKSSRTLIVVIGVLATLITCVLSSFFKSEGGPAPALLKVFGTFVPLIVPIILIISSAVLLNAPLRNAVPVAVYKWPLMFAALIGVTGTAAGLLAWMGQSARNQAARVSAIRGAEDSNQLRMLQEIDSCDVMKSIYPILIFTGDNQDRAVYTRAVAKLKTHPQWQQELIRILDSDGAPEVFQFLSSNDVDDPALFLEPVRNGLSTQARLIRERIRNCSHPSHFYEGMFSYEVERVLRTVDRFKGKGVDYVPAVKEVRAALDEPSEFEKPKFACIRMLDKWLKANGG